MTNTTDLNALVVFPPPLFVGPSLSILLLVLGAKYRSSACLKHRIVFICIFSEHVLFLCSGEEPFLRD